MQVNWQPYIPVLAGGIGYGLGFGWTDSHLGGVVLSVIALAQCVFIYLEEVEDWVSEERRWKLHEKEMLSAFKFSLISYAICLEMRDFPIVEGFKFLACCITFCLLIPLYSDYFISQKKLEILRNCVVEENLLHRKKEAPPVEKDFLNKCMKDIDQLLNEFSVAKANRINSLSNKLVNKMNILIRSSGTNEREFQHRTFVIRVDGKLQTFYFKSSG